VRDRATREPAPELAAAAIDAARAHGLLLLPCGLHGNVIRLLPPISIGPDDLAAGLDALESALRLAAAG
jgi:4-aminobutyrate aminotransferase / (S)-3-amino-2-methylpropionate transaminase / 5-aminovalerate transaminase